LFGAEFFISTTSRRDYSNQVAIAGMRIVSFQNNRGVRPGVLLDDNHVLDFRLAAEKRGGAVYRSVLALIEAGDAGLESISRLAADPVAGSSQATL